MPQDKNESDVSPTLLDQFAMVPLTGIYAAQRDTVQKGAGEGGTLLWKQLRWLTRPPKP
jgi:hypothetical protein